MIAKLDWSIRLVHSNRLKAQGIAYHAPEGQFLDAASGPPDYTSFSLSPKLTYTHPCLYDRSPNSIPTLQWPKLYAACSMQYATGTWPYLGMRRIDPIAEVDKHTVFHLTCPPAFVSCRLHKTQQLPMVRYMAVTTDMFMLEQQSKRAV